MFLVGSVGLAINGSASNRICISAGLAGGSLQSDITSIGEGFDFGELNELAFALQRDPDKLPF